MNFTENLLLMRVNILSSLLFLGCVTIYCSSPTPHFVDLPEDVQAISLLGDTLRSTSNGLPEPLESRIDSMINAKTILDDVASALIWEARKEAYHGNYRTTIEMLSNRVRSGFSSEEKARILRHRGHRYITLREFNYAITDFSIAANLVAGTKDRVEEDGLPNAQNRPLSTLQTNIWYHMGLAHYLKGEYQMAVDSYQNCYDLSTNDDMRVAALYWQYMALRKQGKDVEAGKLLDLISAEMNIIENDSYLKLLLVFKGEFDPEMLLDNESDALSNATVGYGLGFWHDINGRKDRAETIWRNVYDAGNWASFGFIASEVELANLED